MSEIITEKGNQTQSTEMEDLFVRSKAEWKYFYGPYRRCTPAQDQVRIEFPWGEVSGIRTPTADMQSDSIDALSEKTKPEIGRAFIDALRAYFLESQNICLWKVATDAVEPTPVTKPAQDQDPDTTPEEDITEWDSAHIAVEILQTDAESNMPKLREMILLAEDTNFTVEEDSQLAPWLLNFAERYRDSSDSQDAPAVYSAIRTGASMLAPNEADSLCPLLQPGHSIETSLVAVKMLGRIFEAQPPTDVDQHKDLANEVSQIAESLLNRHVIAVIQSAAKAHLAIYALAAMASSDTERMIEIAQGLDAAWFTRRMRHKLTELRDVWASRSDALSEKPFALINRMIETLSAN